MKAIDDIEKETRVALLAYGNKKEITLKEAAALLTGLHYHLSRIKNIIKKWKQENE